MARNGSGNMLGVGGTRSNLGRRALRGGGRDGRVGGGQDAQAQKRELLRKLREKRAGATTEDRAGDGARDDRDGDGGRG